MVTMVTMAFGNQSFGNPGNCGNLGYYGNPGNPGILGNPMQYGCVIIG